MNPSTYDDAWFVKLPKIDLHCHLDGSLRLKTILELAEEQDVTLPAHTEAELFKRVYVGEVASSLAEYLRAFDEVTLKVLQTEAALTRAAFELLEDCAKENIRYIEVRFAPAVHQQKGLSLERIVEAVLTGLKQGAVRFGISWGLIICARRSLSPELSLEMAKLAVSYKQLGVVGFDLVENEALFPAKLHTSAYTYARDHLLARTVHAGEGSGAESIRQALTLCYANRIGHGTRLYEDEELQEYVCDFQIPLEMCLLSNLQTGASSPRLSEHPFIKYYKLGILVTLNTDNRLLTNTSMSREFMMAQRTFNLTFVDIQRIVLNSVQAAFLPYKTKQLLHASLKEELTGLESVRY